MIADDHQHFRQGLKTALAFEAKNKIEILAEVENGEQLLKAIGEKLPDVVLTDVRMPLMDGFEVSRFLSRNYSTIGVIALSNFTDDVFIQNMLNAGAKGYLTKSASSQEIVTAITTVFDGGIYNNSYTIKNLSPQPRLPQYNNRIEKIAFSEKEIHIMRLICKQYTTKIIASETHLSIRGVEDHIKKIKEKSLTENMVGIALYAIKHNIVSLADLTL